MDEDLRFRRGKFEIHSDTIRENPAEVMVVLSQVLIVRAEQMYMRNAIEYRAYCPLFRMVEPSECTPKYEFTLHTDEDGNTTLVGVVEV